MPMVPTNLQKAIAQAFKDMRDFTQSTGDNSDAAIDKLALDLSLAIDTYIRSATVMTAGGGPVTGVGTGPTAVVQVIGAAAPVISSGNIT